MKLNKDDIYGIAGSVAFHLFILLILGFTVLKTVVPDEDERRREKTERGG